MEVFISILSLLISFAAFGFSYYSFRKTQKENIMPILIFSRITAEIWQIKNVGKGAAMAIRVSEKDNQEKWGTTISFYPIASNGVVEIPFLTKGKMLAATYKDTKGNEYSSFCEFGINQFLERNEFPYLVSGMDEQSYRDMREQYRQMF